MKKQLHPGARWLFRIRSYTSLIVLAAILIVWGGGFISLILNYSDNPGFASFAVVGWVILVIVAIIIIGEIYTRMAYNRWFYEFTDSNLKIERGIIWKRYSNVPYERVQNVDIQRGIIARMLGFSSVNIQTAGYGGYTGRGQGGWAEGYIPAVDMHEAEQIREFAMKKISRRHNQGL